MALEIGSYFVTRKQPPLSAEEQATVDRFHDLYYRRWLAGADTINLSWFGYRTLKCPLDLWVYQELLARTRPDVVVEAGTRHGGSALYLAGILDLIGHGEVVTIDIVELPDRPVHRRIAYLAGSSTDPAIVSEVARRVAGRRAMVILDSDHHADHVYAEMLAYAPLVHRNDYMIVEDGNVNGHPAHPGFGPGPMEAVERFLAETDEFEIDRSAERFMMTLNPKGYLKRIKRPRSTERGAP
jgi:cephalosporin hydroxylase